MDDSAYFKKLHYDECREKTKSMVCTEHKKKARTKIDYDFDGTASVYITSYCCKPFAKDIAKVFIDRDEFKEVIIE